MSAPRVLELPQRARTEISLSDGGVWLTQKSELHDEEVGVTVSLEDWPRVCQFVEQTVQEGRLAADD